MKVRFSKFLLLFALAFTLQLSPNSVEAQCPMCKMGAESNLNQGGTAATGLNDGILYMFATPYLVVGGLAFFWWYNRRKEDEEDLDLAKISDAQRN